MAERAKNGPDSQPRGAAAASGRYRLFASLGRGGMADVFVGVAQGGMGFNRLVVVKKLRAGRLEDTAFVNMFLDEGRLAARLNHPNVIHTYEIGEFDGTYFLAMEYLDGQSISAISKALVPEKPVAPALWVKVISEALNGLHYAHELKDYDGTPLNVIHRDVSPQNLFITYDGRVKLVDFGIAKATLNASHTETGVLKGKISYMAPEQAMGHAIDRRADIFPMSAVLWELLAGRRLITGDAVAALHNLLNEPIRSLRDVAPDVDEGLSAIVMKGLEKDPAARYQTAAEMRAALEGWLRDKGHTIDEAQIGAFVSERFSERRREMRKQIQDHIADTSSDLATINTMMMTSGTLPSLASGSRSLPHSAPWRARIVDESDVSAVKPATEGRSKRGLLTALVVLGVAAVAAVWMVAARTLAIVPVAPAQSAPRDETISLTLIAAPPEATLYLDGNRLPGNPYTGSYSRDDRGHDLRVEAPGFGSSARTIRLDSNATYEVALVAVAPPPPPSASAAPEKPAVVPPVVPPRAGPKGVGKTPASLPTLEKEPWK
jgi:eukaryotic-like serine/threonine-protein kinase